MNEVAFHLGLGGVSNFLFGGGEDSFLRHTGKSTNSGVQSLKVHGLFRTQRIVCCGSSFQRSYRSETGTEDKARL